MSLPLVSVPDTVLFLVLFVIYISSDLTAIELNGKTIGKKSKAKPTNGR